MLELQKCDLGHPLKAGSWEDSMQGKSFGFIVLTACAVAAGLPAAAQSPSARGVPVFEVDKSWPKSPPPSKLGDASSFAIDAQDNV